MAERNGKERVIVITRCEGNVMASKLQVPEMYRRGVEAIQINVEYIDELCIY